MGRGKRGGAEAHQSVSLVMQRYKIGLLLNEACAATPVPIGGFRSLWGAKAYADLCFIVATGRRAGGTALEAIRNAIAVN